MARAYCRGWMEETNALDREYLRLLRAAPLPVAIHRDGRWRFLNDAALALLGVSSQQALIGKPVLDVVVPEDHEVALERRLRVEHSAQPVESREFRVIRPDGETLNVESRSIPVLFEGEPSSLTTVQDVTEARRAQRALKRDVAEVERARRRLDESERRYRQLFEDSLDAVYVTDARGRILEMNPAGLEMFGYSAEEVEGISAEDLYADPSDRVRFQRAIATRGSVAGYEVKLRLKDGEVLDALITATLDRDGDGTPTGYKGIIRDITERKEFEEQLERRALHDPLTELPNRALFWDRLETALSRTSRHGGTLAILFMDLDRFKIINDNFGHVAGDRLLTAVANRLLTAVRDPDTVARFGGDEFIVLVENLAGPDDLRQVADRILESFKMPFVLGGKDVHVATSIGAVMARSGDADGACAREWGEELVRRADRAMYRAKAQPGTGVRMYDPSLDEEGRDTLHRETELRQAIGRPQFLLHYQPIVRLDEGRIVAFEALARWDHPERGLLYPGQFLSLAEETGLIVPLGEQLLESACRQVAEWNRGVARDRPLFLHVNVSPRQFEAADFVSTLCGILERTGLRPDLLELEITEHLVFHYRERTRELRAHGIGISVDDFGTGYASLSYVKHLAADVLKIDQEFVRGIDADVRDRAIIKMILSLAETLDLNVVAEGIERAAQLEQLRVLGCGWGQGFLFAHPSPPEVCERLLAEDPRW